MRTKQGLRFHRADLERLPEYVPSARPELKQVVKLDMNENPYGPSPRAIKALASAQEWHYYPEQEELRAALAAYVCVPPENIVLGNGSDESIDLLLRATLEPGDTVIDCPPSFQMYGVTARANRATLVEIPRRNDFSLDLEKVIFTVRSTNAKVVLLASPNNPDGGLLPRADLEALLALPSLIVVDEAYAEFAGESAVDLTTHHDNLVILRTFSKWAGLAGLRIGYAIMPASLARAVLKLKGPYNVNAAALIAARASLDDLDYLSSRVAAIVAERERMSAELARFWFLQPFPSRANFVLCGLNGLRARELRAELFDRGILIRSYQAPPLKNHVRITIGTPEQNELVLKALRAIGELENGKNGDR